MLATMFEAHKERWDDVRELLAILVEVTDRNGLWFFEANKTKEASVPEPVDIRRPWSARNGAEDLERRPATADEMKAFFGGAVEFTPTKQH